MKDEAKEATAGGSSLPAPRLKRFVYRNKIGQAVIHRGDHEHRALPITGGQRINLVVWCEARR